MNYFIDLREVCQGLQRTKYKKSHDNDFIVVFSNSCLKAYFFGRTSGSDKVKLFYENCALNFRLLSPFFVFSCDDHSATAPCLIIMDVGWTQNLNQKNLFSINVQAQLFLPAKIHLFSQLMAI